MERPELQGEIDSEIAQTQGQRELLRGRFVSLGGVATTTLVLVVLNLLAFFLSPAYGSVWIASSLLVCLVLSVVAFLPTTRTTAGIGGIFLPLKKLRNVPGSNKKVLAALFLSSFLVGGVPLVPGMLVLLGLSILFALVTLLTVPALVLPMAGIIGQALLMVFFYLWLFRLRPFSADFLQHLVETITILRERSKRRNRRVMVEFGLLITISAAVLIGVFILPGFSIKLITMGPGDALTLYILPFVLVMITQMIIVRGWQVNESRRWAEDFLLNKQEILLRLKEEAASEGTDLEQLRERLLITRIMRLQSHDLFGHLPIFSFFPDLDILLSKDLQEELALITPSEALRTTGF
jgi:MFS family permease